MIRGTRECLSRGANILPSGVDMDSATDLSNQENESLGGEVMESLGEPAEAGENVENESHGSIGSENVNDPLYVQKRLKQQKRAHEREIRELHARIGEMQSRTNQMPEQNQNPYGNQQTGDVSEQIQKAVSYALQHKEMEERKAKEAEQAAHINKQYQELHKHLDKTADKYDDFDDVVRGDHAPFTPHMRDAALFLPKTGAGSAGEVLYKLGKNPEELSRISKLHPLDQASELVKLSHALNSGGAKSSTETSKPLGQVKNSPVNNSHAVTEKTPVSELRQRMKTGWK